ncbi:MAG: hypothetical protein KDD52_06390 [Bdellovibrionales bacterium]|nr:hypothetical protein [Bdellovibrionales bacterium]
MIFDRIPMIEKLFFEKLSTSRFQSTEPPFFFSSDVAMDLLESMLCSRLLDYQARKLKALGQAFYTISSAGHESNVVFGHLLREDDPCLLHYRSGALMLERERLGDRNALQDMLFSLCASKYDPVSEGRHKVWGSKKLWVFPQTSTIASHLPKAVGTAWAIEKAKKSNIDFPLSRDSIVCCSFGDASVNHASALTAFNAASWMRHQNLPLPLLFLCEDNGLGISVKTPPDWIRARFSSFPHLKYVEADGQKLEECFEKAQWAIEYVRQERKPVFFHLRTTRLLGHAGSDVESVYRSQEEICASEEKDPIALFASQIIAWGHANETKIKELYDDCKQQIHTLSQDHRLQERLESGTQIRSALYRRKKSVRSVSEQLEKERTFFYQKQGKSFPEASESKKRHMAFWINQALRDILIEYPEALIFGEDVAKKGGVYHVTADLYEEFGGQRVFNTLLDEQMIFGMAMGMGQLGFLPIPEIQYLAYYQNAQDQIRSDAASLSFFSAGQYVNPMVIRIASFAYQKGFGGHFHNDHSLASLMDIPGVIIATPSRGDDAAMMLRTLTHLAKTQGRICFFLEPIALYMTKHLHCEGDGLWECHYPGIEKVLDLGRVSVYGPQKSSYIIFSYANGLYMSLRAAQVLSEKYQISCRVVDLRWLKPLPWESIEMLVKQSEKVLFVDECREYGGPGDRILAHLQNRGLNQGRLIRSIHSMDTYIPLGPSADAVLLREDDIVHAILAMTQINP